MHGYRAPLTWPRRVNAQVFGNKLGCREQARRGDDSGNRRPGHPRSIAAFLSCSAASPSGRHGSGKSLPSPVAKLGISQRFSNALSLSTVYVLRRRLALKQRLWRAGVEKHWRDHLVVIIDPIRNTAR
jgi:hypothetical protein